MNPLALVGIFSAIVQGIPEIEAAVSAMGSLAAGTALTAAQQQALGAAMEAAHYRVQGITPPAVPVPTPAAPPLPTA